MLKTLSAHAGADYKHLDSTVEPKQMLFSTTNGGYG